MDKQRRDLVIEETEERVAASQRADYQPHGLDMALAPWSKEQNMILDGENSAPSLRKSLDEYPSLYEQDCDDDDDYGYDDRSDDGPTSCRDIISSWDMHYYYSD
jgi:exonuclease 3'-5' domain-containing protein 1